MTSDLDMVVNLILLLIGIKAVSIIKGFIPKFLVISWTVYILAAQTDYASQDKDFILWMPVMIGVTLFLSFIHSNKKTKKGEAGKRPDTV